MNDTPTDETKRTNLAPILAPIITLFIGFGAGVVFSEFIPMGKATVIQPSGASSSGSSDRRDRRAIELEEDASADQTADHMTDQMDGAVDHAEEHSEGGAEDGATDDGHGDHGDHGG